MADRNLLAAQSNLPQVLVSAQLAATETLIYQCPGSSSVVVATASICNTSADSRTVNVSVVKAGGTAGAANRAVAIPASDPLRAGDSLVLEPLVGLLLGPGDFISGSASAATSVTITLSGSVSS